MTAATSGYSQFLYSWMCRADALRLRYLVVALDPVLFHGLSGELQTGHDLGRHIGLHDVSRDWNISDDSISSSFHNFKAGRYVATVCGKSKVASIILSAGLDVLFLDSDVGILRPPTLMIPTSPLVHYTYQPEIGPRPDSRLPDCTDQGPKMGNTGVYWARSSPVMINWFRATHDICLTTRSQSEQPLFWKVFQTVPLERVRCSKFPPPTTPYVCTLSPCMTPTGFVKLLHSPHQVVQWLANNRAHPDRLLLAHPNWVIGSKAKKAMLKQLRLWFLGDDNKTCKAQANRTTMQVWAKASASWRAQRTGTTVREWKTAVARQEFKTALHPRIHQAGSMLWTGAILKKTVNNVLHVRGSEVASQDRKGASPRDTLDMRLQKVAYLQQRKTFLPRLYQSLYATQLGSRQLGKGIQGLQPAKGMIGLQGLQRRGVSQFGSLEGISRWERKPGLGLRLDRERQTATDLITGTGRAKQQS